ncbi:hydrogenase nickel incorporation protein HypB [Candidatus Bipolaricaulota bacterium]|nr:hydrogenase nickel incorporation protein HypB [Candidatus Bipolaricaulota bacterium]
MHDINLEDGDILAKQKELASKNEDKLSLHGVRAINVMGAIGSGKTALIEAIHEKVKDKVKLGAVAGDVAGTDDYERFDQAGITAYNLNTHSDCHLDAHLVDHSLENMPLDELDLLFVENVGNLVCPADFPLGTDSEIVVISVTEGEDMVRKHPKIFSQSDIVVINKVDLSEAIGVDPEKPRADYEEINPNGRAIFTAAPKDKGIDELISALNITNN